MLGLVQELRKILKNRALCHAYVYTYTWARRTHGPKILTSHTNCSELHAFWAGIVPLAQVPPTRTHHPTCTRRLSMICLSRICVTYAYASRPFRLTTLTRHSTRTRGLPCFTHFFSSLLSISFLLLHSPLFFPSFNHHPTLPNTIYHHFF